MPVVDATPSPVEASAPAPAEEAALPSAPALASSADEVAPLPVVEAAPLPVVEVAPLPVVEVAPLPVVEAAPLPVVEAAPLPVVEAASAPLGTGTLAAGEGGEARPEVEAPEAQRASIPTPADAVDASGLPSGGLVPLERVRLVLKFDEAGAVDGTPPALSLDAGPASSRAVEDEHSSFFESADEAVAREREAVLAVLREEAKPKAPPSPLQIARRHRARRLVTYVMGGAVLLFGLGSLRVAWHERGAAPALSLAPQTQVAPVVAALPPSAISSAQPPQTVASALPASALPRPAGAVLARELADKASQSFERRRYREAIERAARAVEAEPSEARPYLIWGRALTETGQRAEAQRIFSRCREQATKGPKDECGPGVR